MWWVQLSDQTTQPEAAHKAARKEACGDAESSPKEPNRTTAAAGNAPPAKAATARKQVCSPASSGTHCRVLDQTSQSKNLNRTLISRLIAPDWKEPVSLLIEATGVCCDYELSLQL